jgi:hypothetical protein
MFSCRWSFDLDFGQNYTKLTWASVLLPIDPSAVIEVRRKFVVSNRPWAKWNCEGFTAMRFLQGTVPARGASLAAGLPDNPLLRNEEFRQALAVVARRSRLRDGRRRKTSPAAGKERTVFADRLIGLSLAPGAAVARPASAERKVHLSR